MKTRRLGPFLVCFLALPVLLTGYLEGKEKKKIKNDVCSSATPGSICSAATTCGSATSACEVDIRREGGDSAPVTPNIPNAKANMPFCVKAGTTIKFKSTSKNTGFVLDFGNSSPFEIGTAVVGGADRPISVVAEKPGCYTYSVGACTPGTVYGMCGEDVAQFIVSPK
jgi:plastocyanin